MPQDRQRPDKIELPDAPLNKRRRGLFARGPREPLRALKSDGATVVRLYGVIGGDGITADEFAETLNGIEGDIVLRIHSPGGDPITATAMFNDLCAYRGRIRAEVPSLAASAATIPLMAADEIAVAANAHVMVHRVFSLVIGDARDHRAEAAVLDKIDASLILTYAARTGLPASKLDDMLDRETWMLGSEAVRHGFADRILETRESTPLNFDLSVFDNAPANLAANNSNRVKITSSVDLERRLRDQLGLSHGAARLVAAGGYQALAKDDSTAPIATELAGRIAAATAVLEKKIK